MFGPELHGVESVARWERKGASLFRPTTDRSYRHQLEAFDRLVASIVDFEGSFLFVAAEKPVGTPRQTGLDIDGRETSALRRVLDRVGGLAAARDQNVLVVLDQVNEKTRRARVPVLQDHILGRSAEHPEMLRILEAPTHADSASSACIQLADWVAACVTRAIDHRLLPDSPYAWISRTDALGTTRRSFALESGLLLAGPHQAELSAIDLFSA